MGHHFFSRTWRAPLLLIDSWLPPPALPHSITRDESAQMLRFARAGWLGSTREQAMVGKSSAGHIARPVVTRVAPSSMTPLAATTARTTPESPRVVLSGRLTDVCAELDRMVATEPPGQVA